MSLEVADWEAINRCLVQLYQELDGQRYPQHMLGLLGELVPLDSASMNFFKPPDQLTAVVIPETVATAEQVALVGHYSYESPFGYYLATQDASWKRATDFMPAEDFHKLDLHRLALGPLGVHYQMAGLLFMLDEVAYMVTLHRTHQDFTGRELEILNTLHPHLVTSYINAIVCSRAKHSEARIKAVMETAPGAYGCFDAKGKLAWLQEKAKDWLREFFAGEVLNDGAVPQSIRQLVMESLRQDNAPQHSTQTKGEEVLVICLGASPVGGVILRLERKRRTPLPRFRPLPQFSQRKNEVLQWMVEGKRNSEIAKILHLSPRTVEKHVAEILAELKVENRATAILAAMEFCARVNMG